MLYSVLIRALGLAIKVANYAYFTSRTKILVLLYTVGPTRYCISKIGPLGNVKPSLDKMLLFFSRLSISSVVSSKRNTSECANLTVSAFIIHTLSSEIKCVL